MTKSKKILIISNCILLLFMFLMPVFMVGCSGEDTSTLTTDADNFKNDQGYVVYEITVSSQNGKDEYKYAAWNITVTYTPDYLERILNASTIEVYHKDDLSDEKKAEIEKKYPGKAITYHKNGTISYSSYKDLNNNGFYISGFDTTRETESLDGVTNPKQGVHYRVCTITYLNKITSFKYIVVKSK